MIEFGETAGKNLEEAQMILNHKAAIEYMESAEDDQMSSHEIRSIHALLSENLLGDPAASGRLRTIAVGIGGTTYVPLENPHVLRECFELLVETVNRITDPFEQSLFSIVHLSYLQVFEDVNKRTARLVANIPLIRKNLKPLSFVEVDKAAYVSALLGVTSSVCMMGTSHNSKFCQASFKPKKIGSESTRVIKGFLRSYGKELVGRLRFIASHTCVAKHKRYDFG